MVKGYSKREFAIVVYFILVVLIFQLPEFSLHTLGQESDPSNTTTGSASFPGSNSLTTPSASTIPYPEWMPLVLQILGGGSLAGLAIFGANLALDKYRRPKIVVLKTPVIAQIELTIFDFKEFFYPEELRHLIIYYPKELRRFTVPYNVHRVIVGNDSSYAANDCKASIRTENGEERICWTVPQERYKMTINPQSTEYLDVLASLVGDPAEVFNRLQEMIARIEEKHNSTTQIEYEKPGKELTKSLRANYPSASEIPSVILPTEDGWKSDPRLNRLAPIGDAKLVITSLNGRSEVVEQIRILDSAGQNGFLSFNRKERKKTKEIA